MNTTRRSILRNTALLSLGAVVQPRLLVSSTFAQTCSTTYKGVRIVLSGSWLFCGDDVDSGSMYAVARDLGGSKTHIFPYGVWDPRFEADMPFDRNNPSVQPSYSSSQVTQYSINIGSFKPASDSNALRTVFQNTQKAEPTFKYIDNSTNPYAPLKLNQQKSGIRIIKLPVPSRIHAVAVLADVTINPVTSSGSSTINLSGASTAGVPVTHIFEYDNAKSVQFASEPQHPVGASNVIDFHIHTAIQNDQDMTDHSQEMFLNLMDVLTFSNGNSVSSNDIAMKVPDNDIYTGNDLPCGISEVEIEMTPATKDQAMKSQARKSKAIHGQVTQPLRYANVKTLASCSGGSIGLLPPPCCS